MPLASIRNLLAAALPVFCLMLVLACNTKATAPEAQQQIQSSASSAANDAESPWKMDLNLSPPKPSMNKQMSFILHIVDKRGQPVTGAKVDGALTMKLMDMGIVQMKFAPKGNGDYEGTLKSLDMSGPWTIAVDASSGDTHVKKNFDVIIYD
jgi:nitrogen fixation protein FixH